MVWDSSGASDERRDRLVTQISLRGIIPANLLPFHADFSIDEPEYRRHLSWLAGVRGVTAITCNGHAAEVSSLTRGERQQALAIAGKEVGGRLPVLAGILAEGTLEAVILAKDARAGGAAGILVFPPALFMGGAQLRPEMVVRHFSMIADAVDLPIVVFQYPPAIGIGYSPETLAQLTKIPQVVGVKDWSNDIVAFERNLRALRATGRPVAMLSSYSASLLATFVLGADGTISGMGSVAADLQAELFDAVRQGDLETARKINARLRPLADVFYTPPFLDQHNRMKEALVLLGRWRQAVVRPPLLRVSDGERQRIRAALAGSGLLPG
jgi:4-hydroxy-tetrahydrodipicolinate synthase